MQMFGEKLNLSHITEVPQVQRQLRLILNLLEKLDEGNNTKDREVFPESTQSGWTLPHIL